MVERLSGRACPEPRRAVLRALSHGDTPIDQAIVLFFRAPASFTGEDMAEFHVHGGRAVVAALSTALQSLGSRQAEPGEFSKRAFLNDRMDLTEAEAIADLIDAETSAQHAQALAQANGTLSALYEGWTERLLRARAHLETMIDFADEDLPDGLLDQVRLDVEVLSSELQHHIDDARRGERLRTGIRVAILGAPNAGKSSLMNALAQRDVAIVSSRAGTTRDVLEVHLDIAGLPVIVADTAGLRDTEDEIEAEGMTRARLWAESADLRLLLFDGTIDLDTATSMLIGPASHCVLTKADLPGFRGLMPGASAISLKTGDGLIELLRVLAARVQDLVGTGARPAPTRERHKQHLTHALDACRAFLTAPALDLAAEDLRLATAALGRITGRVDAEALLDVIFRDFCIGK